MTATEFMASCVRRALDVLYHNVTMCWFFGWFVNIKEAKKDHRLVTITVLLRLNLDLSQAFPWSDPVIVLLDAAADANRIDCDSDISTP